MKTIEQPVTPIDTYDQQLKALSLVRTKFIKEIATRRKFDLVTPEPERVRTATGHVYSLRAIGTGDLPIVSNNMTELGEALNRITESEGVPEAFLSQSHEERGKRIRDFGTRTIALIDNETSTPGTTDTIIGAIRSSSTEVYDWYGREAGYRPVITSPEVSRDRSLSDKDRIRLKLELIKFAVSAFIFNNDDGRKYTSQQILVGDPHYQQHDDWAVSEFLDYSEPRYYSQEQVRFQRIRKAPPALITQYRTFDASDIPAAFACAARLK